MNLSNVILAVEDRLSDAVATKILETFGIEIVNKKFQRHIEDFTCKQCGATVKGDGYTNHCPECLWSQHVDINPGDRSAFCQGMMEPVGFTVKHGNYILTHRCRTCGVEKKNKTSKNDNFDAILRLQGEINV